jgi:outer membrane lipoprotein-sorting protein
VTRSLRTPILIGLLVLFGLASSVYAEGMAEGMAEESAEGKPAAHASSNREGQPAPTLEEVMRWLAGSGGVEARFHESRQIAILSEPIESAGMLYFAPPDWLARHVTEPAESRLVVRGGRVMFRDETGTQTLELGSSEVARALVGNTTLLMRGDLEALLAQYKMKFRVEGERWTLDLEPRSRVVRSIMQRLRVQGRGGELIRMESTETSGDITLTTFSEVKLGVDFSAEALAEIFAMHPAPNPAEVSSRTELAP